MSGRKAGGFNGSISSKAPAERKRAHGGIVPLVESCPVERCGIEDDPWRASELPVGWVFVLVTSSREPGRWYCSGACASRGMALAELRVFVTPGGVS